MALSVGDKLGPYEIVAPIGQGGMGAVYRARDTRLGRDVAVKVSQERFSERFAREARTISSLNHPNVCTLYDTGENYLVMELVEGQTLAERIKQTGPLPIADAVAIARQIADALEAAHEKDIVHRDLKPGNIIVRKDGSIKVLDFGLAKVVRDKSATGELDATQSLTLTEAGAVLGTGAYMSPEQVRGEDVDTQTDIWAFGCVLYQMLTGRAPFAQPTLQETLAKILEGEPDYGALPAGTPPSLVRLLRRCLEKRQRDRLHHIGDARVELSDLGDEPDQNLAQPPVQRPVWLWVAAAGAVLLAALVLLIATRPVADLAALSPVHLSIGPVPVSNSLISRDIAVSEDGSLIAYVSGDSIWLRPLGQDAAEPLATGQQPTFSPDGDWVAFDDEFGVYKVPVSGGSSLLITPVSSTGTEGRLLGVAWGPGDTIVYATTGGGIYRVSSSEQSQPELVAPSPEDGIYAWPEFLPGGNVLVNVISDNRPIDRQEIAVVDLDTKEVEIVHEGGVGPIYVAPGGEGLLLYATGNSIGAVSFDLQQNTAGSDPVTLPIQPKISAPYRAAAFDVSRNGTMVHLPEQDSRADWLTWVDSEGNEEVIPANLPPAILGYPRVSPDGGRIAMTLNRGDGRRIWVTDLERGTSQQISGDGFEFFLPQWSLDGQRVFYASSTRGGAFQIYVRNADGTGEEELVSSDASVHMPYRDMPGNRMLFYSGDNLGDLGLLDRNDPVRVEWLLSSETAREVNAAVSPDGQWMAYESNEGGNGFEVYIRPFPNVNERRIQVSVDGGVQPLWDPRGGDALYYRSVNESGVPAAMMAQTVEFSPTFKTVGRPRELFPSDHFVPGGGWSYDISPQDGRFLFVQFSENTRDGEALIWVTLNWFEELNERLAEAGE